MKRFILRFLGISLVVLAFTFLLSEIAFSDDFIIHKTINTQYKKVAWNINLLNNKSDKIRNSTIFLGSSLVQGAVNDSILKINGIKAINMGVPHNGNELWLYFLNRIKKKKPAKIYFLKGKIGYRGLHKLTPLVYTSSELLRSGQNLNLNFVSFIFKKARLSFEFLKFKIFKPEHESIDNQFLNKEDGFVYDIHAIKRKDFDKNIKNSDFDEYFNLYKNGFLYNKEKKQNLFFKKIKILKRYLIHSFFKKDFFHNFKTQQKFIKTAQILCKENNIKFKKIYIPLLVDVNNHSGYNQSRYINVETDYNLILELNTYDFLNSVEYWSDKDHLSKEGAHVFTERLVHHLNNSSD